MPRRAGAVLEGLLTPRDSKVPLLLFEVLLNELPRLSDSWDPPVVNIRIVLLMEPVLPFMLLYFSFIILLSPERGSLMSSGLELWL